MKFIFYFILLSSAIALQIYVIKNNSSPMNFPNFIFSKAESGGDSQYIFRGGPLRQGRYEGVLLPTAKVQWQSEQLNFQIHSASKSTPAIDQTGIYVATDAGWLIAYELDSFKIRWKWFFPDGYGGMHSTPVTDEKYIYFGTYRGKFYCLSKADGQIKWITHLADAVGSSPVIVGDSIYVGAEFDQRQGFLAKMDRETGTVRWTSQLLGEQTHSSPAVDIEKRRVFIGDNAGYVSAFDSENGSLLWKVEVGGEVKGTIVIVDHNIYFSSWSNKFYSISGENGEVIWESELKGKSQSSAAYSEIEQLFFVLSQDKNALYAIDKATGEQIWSRRIKRGRLGISSPILLEESSKEILISACEQKLICVYNPKNGKLLNKIPVPAMLTGSFSYYQGFIFMNLDNAGLVVIK